MSPSSQESIRVNKISAVILTKNSAGRIAEVLESLQKLDEIVVVDNGSTDETLEIVRQFDHVKLHEEAFIGFGPLKQKAVAYATHDWIISVDSDEVATPEVIEELLQMSLDEKSVYALRFYNYYRGKRVQCCGWYPDKKLRLFNRKFANFNDALVHENIESLSGNTVVTGELQEHFHHYSYDCIEEFMDKMQRYSTLWAEQNQGKKSSSPAKATGRFFWTFIKNYILQKGILYGYEGFLVSVYNAQVAFWKYMKLYELNRFKP